MWALQGAGVETGIDLEALVETSVWMAGQLGRPSPSSVVRALSGGLTGHVPDRVTAHACDFM